MIGLSELPHIVMGACMEVHRELGPGWDAFAYRAALARELRDREVFFRTDVAIAVTYKGQSIPTAAVLDMVVEDRFVVLVHALPGGFEPVHKERLTSYLRQSGYSSGFLINFDVIDLREGVKRIVLMPTTS